MNRKNPTCRFAYFRSTGAYLGPPRDTPLTPRMIRGGGRVSVFYVAHGGFFVNYYSSTAGA